MGNFYVTFTAKGLHQQPIAAALRQGGKHAYVLPAEGNFTVFTEEDSDAQAASAIIEVGQAVSGHIQSQILAVLNHDDDILQYWLFDNGKLADEYNSWPEYFEGGEQEAAGGDEQLLCQFADRPASAGHINEVLRGTDYVFAMDRHLAILHILGLPKSGFGAGYRYLEAGEHPEGVDPKTIIHIA